mgnify:CR=1 FL=1
MRGHLGRFSGLSRLSRTGRIRLCKRQNRSVGRIRPTAYMAVSDRPCSSGHDERDIVSRAGRKSVGELPPARPRCTHDAPGIPPLSPAGDVPADRSPRPRLAMNGAYFTPAASDHASITMRRAYSTVTRNSRHDQPGIPRLDPLAAESGVHHDAPGMVRRIMRPSRCAGHTSSEQSFITIHRACRRFPLRRRIISSSRCAGHGSSDHASITMHRAYSPLLSDRMSITMHRAWLVADRPASAKTYTLDH